MPADGDPSDVCIVGAGPAGAVLASKLVEAGRSVTLVEHGREFSAEERRTLLENRRRGAEPGTYNHAIPEDAQIAYNPVEASGYTYYQSRVPALGGSSLHWSAHCPRPLPSDLRGFPFDYAALEPWLGKAESELGVAGDPDDPLAAPRSAPFPMPAHARSFFERELLAPACKKLGWTLCSNPVAIPSRPFGERVACRACRLCELCPSGARYSADQLHIPRFARSARARLLTETHVRRLELDRRGRATHALAVDRRSGKALSIAAKTFVIAAGGVESTRLLLLTDGAAKRPRLGQGFADDVMIATQLLCDRDVGIGLGFATTAIHHFRARAEGGVFKLNAYPRLFDRKTLVQRAARSGKLDPSALGGDAKRAVTLVALVEKERTGTVELDPARRDTHGDPIARITLPYSERDEKTLGAAAGALRELAAALGAEVIDDGHRSGVRLWGAHPLGSAAMGKSAKDGVCDAHGRVFGLSNVRVLSSATFPGLGATNPTLTLVALALRMAEALSGDKP